MKPWPCGKLIDWLPKVPDRTPACNRVNCVQGVKVPVSVPELYTRTLPALTVEPFVTLRRAAPPGVLLYPPKSNRPVTVHSPPPFSVADPCEGGSSAFVNDAIEAVALITLSPSVMARLPLPR